MFIVVFSLEMTDIGNLCIKITIMLKKKCHTLHLYLCLVNVLVNVCRITKCNVRIVVEKLEVL